MNLTTLIPHPLRSTMMIRVCTNATDAVTYPQLAPITASASYGRSVGNAGAYINPAGTIKHAPPTSTNAKPTTGYPIPTMTALFNKTRVGGRNRPSQGRGDDEFVIADLKTKQ